MRLVPRGSDLNPCPPGGRAAGARRRLRVLVDVAEGLGDEARQPCVVAHDLRARCLLHVDALGVAGRVVAVLHNLGVLNAAGDRARQGPVGRAPAVLAVRYGQRWRARRGRAYAKVFQPAGGWLADRVGRRDLGGGLVIGLGDGVCRRFADDPA